MDKEKCIQLHEKEYGELQFIDKNGSSHNYTPHIGAIYLKVDTLNLSEEYAHTIFDKELPHQPNTKKFIQGTGSLYDKSISVIGDPDNKTSHVALSIHVYNTEELDRLQQYVLEDRNDKTSSYLTAILGYWESSNKDKWLLDLHVAEKTLESLANAILSKQVRSLYIGVQLRNLYTDAGFGALDFDEPVNLFLRPRISDGNTRSPQVAYGQLNVWSLKFAEIAKLSDPFGREPTLESAINIVEEPREPSDTEITLTSLERLSASVEALRSTVIRLSWFLAAALIISAFIR